MKRWAYVGLIVTSIAINLNIKMIVIKEKSLIRK